MKNSQAQARCRDPPGGIQPWRHFSPRRDVVAVSPADLEHLCEVADEAGACPGLSDRADINPAADEGPMLGRIAATQVIRDVAGADISGTMLQLELGPQYAPSNKVTLGGAWEPRHPAFVPARPYLRLSRDRR